MWRVGNPHKPTRNCAQRQARALYSSVVVPNRCQKWVLCVVLWSQAAYEHWHDLSILCAIACGALGTLTSLLVIALNGKLVRCIHRLSCQTGVRSGFCVSFYGRNLPMNIGTIYRFSALLHVARWEPSQAY